MILNYKNHSDQCTLHKEAATKQMQKKKRKKILFLIPSLAGGGGEKILLTILAGLNREKFIPHIVLLERVIQYRGIMPEDVPVYCLNEEKEKKFFRSIFLLLFKIYPKLKPDIVVSFLEYANLVVLFSKKLSLYRFPVIICQHNFVSISLKHKRRNRLWPLIIKIIYPWADKIITVSKKMASDLINNFNMPRRRVQVIYNGLDLRSIERLMKQPGSTEGDKTPAIIACGRLTRQKNYPLLLRAFANISSQVDSKLLILGQGEEKASLERLSLDLGIRHKVEFLGFKDNPFIYMANADIFVLSSDWEGFPNVILEAMACGVPVISTKCHSGPDEIITNEVNGLLVPVGDINAMAQAILKLLKDTQLRKKLSSSAGERVKKFSLDKMVKEYERIFDELPERLF
jgi:glycosyltransferase involved in cell wall biosynthesis